MFPDSPHVVYQRNPLEEVLCQVRFPPILRIAAEPPAEFQDRIRVAYPTLKETQTDPTLTLPDEVRALLGGLGGVLPESRKSEYAFVSADEKWALTLTRDFLALTTKAYTNWVEFRARLADATQHLSDIYKPAFFTRVGLRYKDVIRRSALGLSDVPWTDLLKPHITAEIGDPDIAARVESATRILVIRLEEQGAQVRIHHGLATDQETKEACYLIDSDFYKSSGRTEVANALVLLDGFNRVAGRLFRWCITDRLHEALDPRTRAK